MNWFGYLCGYTEYIIAIFVDNLSLTSELLRTLGLFMSAIWEQKFRKHFLL